MMWLKWWAISTLALLAGCAGVGGTGQGREMAGYANPVNIIDTQRLYQMDRTIVQDPELIRDNDLSRIEVENLHLCEQTGWKPQIPLQKTLQDTLDFWRKCDHES